MCIFCKIVNGEIPSNKVYEDDNFLAFYDISGMTKGHTLVIPKKHFDNIFELDDETAAKLFVLVKDLSKKFKEDPEVLGVNIVNNNGEVAGQTVKHIHIHIIPRYKDDNFDLKFEKK